MKQIMAKEVIICDNCNKDNGYCYTCSGCAKDICSDCVSTDCKQFQNGLTWNSPTRGIYCKECYTKFSPGGVDPLFDTFVTLEKLIKKRELLLKEASIRGDALEKKIEELLELKQKQIKTSNNDLLKLKTILQEHDNKCLSPY